MYNDRVELFVFQYNYSKRRQSRQQSQYSGEPWLLFIIFSLYIYSKFFVILIIFWLPCSLFQVNPLWLSFLRTLRVFFQLLFKTLWWFAGISCCLSLKAVCFTFSSQRKKLFSFKKLEAKNWTCQTYRWLFSMILIPSTLQSILEWTSFGPSLWYCHSADNCSQSFAPCCI